MNDREVLYLWTYPKNPSLPSKIIKNRLKTDYSHVCMAIWINSLQYYRVYQASHGWVNSVKLDNFLKYNNVIKSSEVWSTYERGNIDCNWSKQMEYLDAQTGKKYSIWGAIAATIPLLRKMSIGDDDNDTFICSEYAFGTYTLPNPRKYGKYNGDYVDPHDFERIVSNDGNKIRSGLQSSRLR